MNLRGILSLTLLLLLSCSIVSATAMMADSDSAKLNGIQRAKRADDADPLQAVVTQMAQEMTSLRAQLEAVMNEVNNAKGSTFTRWGSSTCPADSRLVYSGVVGGSFYDDEGGSSNRLCLTLTPEFDATNHQDTWYSNVYGTEYEFIADRHDYEVPCAVCEAVHISTVMVPGTKTCPEGWTVQYWGHITGSSVQHRSAGEYLCVDNSPEGAGASVNHDQAVLYYTAVRCGSLPCPPYVNDRVVTCVVCSK